MENEFESLPQAPEKNKLDESLKKDEEEQKLLSEHDIPPTLDDNHFNDDRAKAAIEQRENIEHERADVSRLIIRDGNGFSNTQIGTLVQKDENGAILQIGKNIGLKYDSEMFDKNNVNDRVAVFMVNEEHRVMAASEFERQQQETGHERAVELDNEM